MHDQNLNFKVQIHRATMRHRKLVTERTTKPLALTLYDLVLEYIVAHMSKQRFPFELYLLSIGLIQRLLVYEKRCNARLAYNWKSLWSALINLLKFLVYQEQYLVKKFNIFTLATQVRKSTFLSFNSHFNFPGNKHFQLFHLVRRHISQNHTKL
jgi:hypothetical protein